MTVPSAYVPVTNQQTNYIYLNTNTLAITVNTTGFPSANCVPIAIAVANSFYVVTLVDARADIAVIPGANGANGATGPTGATGSTGATGAPGSTNIGILDIQGYGDAPSNLKGTPAHVASSTAGAVLHIDFTQNFNNGGGVVIPKGGNACAIAGPPLAPISVIVSGGPSGSTTVKYAIAGVDSLGGITAVSTATAVTTDPAIFNPVFCTVTAATASAGVVTATFSTSINASSGQMIYVSGITGSGATWNGLWPVASAPAANSVTYNVSGATGTGTTSGTTKGRLSNAVQISSISRSAAGVITINTVQNHGLAVKLTGNNPNYLIVNGVTGDTSLNGYWVIQTTPSATQITCNTGNLTASTGTATLGAAGVQAFEYNYLALPPLTTAYTLTSAGASNGIYQGTFAGGASNGLVGQGVVVTGFTNSANNGTFTITASSATQITTGNTSSVSESHAGVATSGGGTIAYYVYSDSANPGGTMALIGKTYIGESNFKDWGPLFMSNYAPPAYVPTTAPGAAQNQLFGATILSGAGTTTMTLSAVIPNPTVGLLVQHDDSQALIAAIAAATASTSYKGAVYVSPPTSPSQNPMYVFNYPVSIPSSVSIVLGCQVQVNETWTFASNNQLKVLQPSVNPITTEFGQGPYQYFAGAANPLVWTGGGFVCSDVMFYTSGNSQTGVQVQGIAGLPQGLYNIFKHCCFLTIGNSIAQPNSVGTLLNSAGLTSFEDCIWEASHPFDGSNSLGNPTWLPYLPALNIHWSDQVSNGCGQISLYGNCSFSGRGIGFDQLHFTQGNAIYEFGGQAGVEFQSPSTPSLFAWNGGFTKINMKNWVNDSLPAPMLFNCNGNALRSGGVTIENCVMAGGNVVCGQQMYGLEIKNFLASNATAQQQLLWGTGVLTKVVYIPVTTSGGSTDTISVPGALAISGCSLTPTSSGAAATGAYIPPGTKTQGSVVINYASPSAGQTFDLFVTAGF